VDRLNHVKIVTPDPDAVDRFLREVLDIPEGWPLGRVRPVDDPPSGGPLSIERVESARGTAGLNGFITGSSESRQFQIAQGDQARIWAVAIGTRHLERAHERCVERGIACTEPAVAEWADSSVRYFFAEVGGVLFEVMRAEPAVSSSADP
jgi:catechol 2,3-dioxygenase-like lactoylglutathione lyase family enzyme